LNRSWGSEFFTYNFTITGVAENTYYVRGKSVGTSSGTKFSTSQEVTVTDDITLTPGVGTLTVSGKVPLNELYIGTFGGYVYTSNPPDGIVCGRIGQFVLLSQASDEYTVQWCAIGNLASWPTPATDAARAVQAGQETLNAEYGVITGIVGNEFFGFVFQKRAITKFTYVGGDVVWVVETFETSRGCVDYNRFSRVDDTVYFESEFGYHAVEGAQIVDIGHGSVDDSYTPTLGSFQRTVAANPSLQTIFFEQNNVAFNYKTGQWVLQSSLSGTPYYPIDLANGVVGQIVYSGTAVQLQDSTNGVDEDATLTTLATDLNQGGRAVVNGVRPLINGGSSTVRIGNQDGLSDTVTWSSGASINSRTKYANMRAEGRFLRTEVVITGGFETLMGADIDFANQGNV
jgi:hypothetical protein